MEPVLAGGALWQAPDVQQGEAGDRLSRMKERALLQAHLSNATSAPSDDVLSSGALLPECRGTLSDVRMSLICVVVEVLSIGCI